ncbi:MAG TPA: tRNA (adenosine(37)-N6)-threonylcarbamoyltransferase complex dimerization subunit type 1 TsaB [Hanamia sp.]
MNYILNIHTTTENAVVNLCNASKVITTLENPDPKKHASFLHMAVEQILNDTGVKANDLSAVGVTCGPGSYTGIRVGLASAKGLCFALNIPLISLNTLEIMGLSLIEIVKDKNALYCPMVDARRMEVFSAVYGHDLKEVIPASAVVLSENTFQDLIAAQPVYFSGSGVPKLKKLNSQLPDSRFFSEVSISSESLCACSWEKFQAKIFENIENASPLYLKEFYTVERNK